MRMLVTTTLLIWCMHLCCPVCAFAEYVVTPVDSFDMETGDIASFAILRDDLWVLTTNGDSLYSFSRTDGAENGVTALPCSGYGYVSTYEGVPYLLNGNDGTLRAFADGLWQAPLYDTGAIVPDIRWPCVRSKFVFAVTGSGMSSHFCSIDTEADTLYNHVFTKGTPRGLAFYDGYAWYLSCSPGAQPRLRVYDTAAGWGEVQRITLHCIDGLGLAVSGDSMWVYSEATGRFYRYSIEQTTDISNGYPEAGRSDESITAVYNAVEHRIAFNALPGIRWTVDIYTLDGMRIGRAAGEERFQWDSAAAGHGVFVLVQSHAEKQLVQRILID